MSKRQGISPKVPLVYDKIDGPYRLNKDILSMIRQNFKNLVMTNPGERIMEPDFGVGLHGILFEHMTGDLFGDVVSKIKEQVGIYIPAININSIDFITSDEDQALSPNAVQIVISYNVTPINAQDELQITTTMTN